MPTPKIKSIHIDYGFPLVWATHTLSTIAGPADIWKVDITALIIDLAFWLGIMLYFFNREHSNR